MTLNLSVAYNSVGKNEEALQTLKDAAALDPSNQQIFYNLGLLYHEIGDLPSALENFHKAEQLGSGNPRLYYNYGLALQQLGKIKEGERILQKGLSMYPQDASINYALAFLYWQQDLPQKARRHANVLRNSDPNNPNYQELLRNLGI